jgi:hypothetical protein
VHQFWFGFLAAGIMSRLAKAMIAYAALAVLAFATLSDTRIRAGTLLILGLFAFKSWMRRNEVMHPEGDREAE